MAWIWYGWPVLHTIIWCFCVSPWQNKRNRWIEASGKNPNNISDMTTNQQNIAKATQSSEKETQHTYFAWKRTKTHSLTPPHTEHCVVAALETDMQNVLYVLSHRTIISSWHTHIHRWLVLRPLAEYKRAYTHTYNGHRATNKEKLFCSIFCVFECVYVVTTSMSTSTTTTSSPSPLCVAKVPFSRKQIQHVYGIHVLHTTLAVYLHCTNEFYECSKREKRCVRV